MSGAVTMRTVVAVGRRPWLWPTAVRSVLRMAPRGWWRRGPWLPLPDPAYLEFRLTTAFGPDAGAAPPDEVVSFLEWCRAWPGGRE